MKLEKILDNLNSFEKNSFLKIIDNILTENPKNIKAVDTILNDTSRDLKNIDNINISKVFSLLKDEFSEFVKGEFVKTTSQLDILIDIISRDGNSIMKIDWFARLYEKELSNIVKKVKQFNNDLENEKSELSIQRKRDYKIYTECLKKAYTNDDENNQERKITTDEQGILLTLAKQLSLSQEELKLINYTIVPLQKQDIDYIINELKSIGVIFYSKKNNTVYVADEMVRLVRKLRGKEVADKFFRRVLRLLREPQINLICRNHNLDWKMDLNDKINQIINSGIPFSSVLSEDIYKPNTTLTEKKKTINNLCDKGLKITPALKGVVIEEKIENLIVYFEDIEKDEKIGISIDGYEKLLIDLDSALPKLNKVLRDEFELQEENVLKSSYLIDYNIKPRDVLELVAEKDLEAFCKLKEIKTRGDIILNVLEAYKDSENLYLENYENIGFRNLSKLKENGIIIKEADLGVKFEELTKKLFEGLGFNVDESLRKSLNTSKDKIDIVLNIGNNDLILVECKTVKESGYNKFSSVSRQLKSYSNLGNAKGYRVIKSLLVAPDFSDEFIKDCGLEYELNLSLITASSLIKILNGFKESKLKVFPHNLLMRDVLIQEDRVLKAIGK